MDPRQNAGSRLDQLTLQFVVQDQGWIDTDEFSRDNHVSHSFHISEILHSRAGLLGLCPEVFARYHK